jgi:hypothetical protein
MAVKRNCVNLSLPLMFLLILIIAVSCLPALAFMDDYLPLSKTEISSSFPVKYQGLLDSKHIIKTLPAGPSGLIVSTNQNGDLLFTGNDKLQKKWTIAISDEGSAPYYAFTADLDHDGTPDLILVCGTGGNGLAPSAHLLCFLFDASGRPVPFTADGYFDYNEHGIRELVDIDGDGKADLVYMNYDEGYWITSLYQARNGRWQKLQGRCGSWIFPIYTRFTNRENHTPVTPESGRHPFAPNLSNDHTTTQGRLLDYQWANVNQSEDIQLNVKTPRDEIVTCKPVSWYSTFSIVLDESNGRQIVSLSANEKSVRTLLDKIVATKCTVTLFGQRRPNSSSPEILWAVPQSKDIQSSQPKSK